MAYSEELSMFTVHHYSKNETELFMASSVWHTDLYVYPTFTNLLNCDYCHLCISVCRQGAVTMPGSARTG